MSPVRYSSGPVGAYVPQSSTPLTVPSGEDTTEGEDAAVSLPVSLKLSLLLPVVAVAEAAEFGEGDLDNVVDSDSTPLPGGWLTLSLSSTVRDDEGRSKGGGEGAPPLLPVLTTEVSSKGIVSEHRRDDIFSQRSFIFEFSSAQKVTFLWSFQVLERCDISPFLLSSSGYIKGCVVASKLSKGFCVLEEFVFWFRVLCVHGLER